MTAIALSPIELSELASCEMVIEHGLKVFQAVGLALITIREKRLYRAAFNTFEESCESKWGFTDEHARRFMRGAEVVNNITLTPPIGGVLPANLEQVRPLITLTPADQVAAWQEAVETAPNGKITGAHVEQVAQQFKPINSRPGGVHPSAEGVESDLDEDGMPLVDHMDEAINNRFADQVDTDDEDDDEVIGVGDVIAYRGHNYKVRASGSKIWLDVASSHPLRSRGLDIDDVTLIERAPRRPATTPPAKTNQLTEREIPIVDGMLISESHPIGYAGLYATDEAMGYGNALCRSCGQRHNGWTPIPAGRWRCRCGETTNDDTMDIEGKAEYDLAQRLAKQRNGNGHKPGTSAPDPVTTDDTNDEWYTPEDIVDLVRDFLRGIDVDPASCEYAQRRIKANSYYTKARSGLNANWGDGGQSVFMNPPYSYPLVEKFGFKLIEQYENGYIREAVVLVNNRTDAGWFQTLLANADACCFVSGRINFERPGADLPGNRQGQAFFYFGNRVEEFHHAFDSYGVIVRCVPAPEAVQP